MPNGILIIDKPQDWTSMDDAHRAAAWASGGIGHATPWIPWQPACCLSLGTGHPGGGVRL